MRRKVDKPAKSRTGDVIYLVQEEQIGHPLPVDLDKPYPPMPCLDPTGPKPSPFSWADVRSVTRE